MPVTNPKKPCPMGCGLILTSNLIPRHARRCLGSTPTMDDLCRVGDVVRDPDGCWTWGAKHQQGDPSRYGVVSNETRKRFGEAYAHRVALVLDGRPAGGLNALHHCDNPPCIRPEHLYVGTQADNSRDAWTRGRAKGTLDTWTPEQWAAWHWRRWGHRPDPICVICGEPFKARPRKPRQTCGPKCESAFRSIRNTEAKAKQRTTPSL